MSEKTEYDELLKIGFYYDIKLKNNIEFNNCYLLVKDLDSRMIKIRHRMEIANGKIKIFREEMINMNEVFRVTLPKKQRFFWIYDEARDINSATLDDRCLTDQDVRFNKEIKFYDSVEDAVKDIVIEKIAKSENPKDWRLTFYGSNACMAKHTGHSLKDGGWEGSRSNLVYETLSELDAQQTER